MPKKNVSKEKYLPKNLLMKKKNSTEKQIEEHKCFDQKICDEIFEGKEIFQTIFEPKKSFKQIEF